MTRTIQDDELILWEVFATSGDWGFPDRGKMVFQCLTEPGRRARVLEREGDVSQVEAEIVELDDRALLSLFREAEPLS